jgi:pimeloyl-ACP methyl ester carboxylesterase
MRIDRGFQRLASGLIHFRETPEVAGATPLVMIHGGPGSSAGLVPLMTGLAAERQVIAPDLPGHGDSDPPSAPTSIPNYADTIRELLRARGIDRCDLYGHHSGAQIACELAIAEPTNVRRLILDGVALFSPDQRREFIAHYAPPLVPQADGAHLLWAWNFARNLTRFFPWYREEDACRLQPGTILPPEAITQIALDVLKVWPSYHLLYAAAFAHDMATRLPELTTPALVLEVTGDPLAEFAARAAELAGQGPCLTVTRTTRPTAIADFLHG